MQFALISALLVSVCGGVVGSLIVSNRMVFLGGGVSHSAFGGVGLGLYFGFSTTLGAALAALLMSLILLYFIVRQKTSIDSFIATAWAFGMALGVILIDITPGYASDMSSYLFGSILTVQPADLAIIALYDALLLCFVGLYYREIISVSYDEVFCRLKKLPVNALLLCIYIFVSLGIVMSMNIAGLILVLSILSIPAYIAGLWTHSLRAMMALAGALSFIFICAGLLLSYKYSLSIGACVTMCAIAGMILTNLAAAVLRRKNG